jgi:hypothetical protein
MSDWTGIHLTTEKILGRGVILGKKSTERKIILCEGISKSDRPGEDQTLLEKAADGWEIYSLGKRETVLELFHELDNHGTWRGLYAVVDRDEQKKKFSHDNILCWPGARDLECLLLRSEAWPRLIRTVLNPRTGFKLRPTPPRLSDDPSLLPSQFEIDESASAIAWKMHDTPIEDGKGGKYAYRHTKWLVDDNGEFAGFQNPYYLEALLPGSEEEPMKLPNDLKEIVEFLLDEGFDKDLEILDAEERSRGMQGKRIIDLLAIRMLSETFHSRDESGIGDGEFRNLKIALVKKKECSNLRSMILKRVRMEEMRNHFPEFA